MENHILELKSISKSFGGLKALDQISLFLDKGEVLGLVGDNAAGKSTLMKIITGTYQADEGEIYFNGNRIVHNSPAGSKKLGIEMVYQNLQLCPNLDVPANLFLGRELNKITFLQRRQMEADAVKILERLKIDMENPRKRVDKLSGGQQQAVAIGKAVSFNPKIVIMDEPTANLALKEIDKVLGIILNLKSQGISVIIISHRLEDVFSVADRIFVMKHGCQVATKNKSETDRTEILHLMFGEVN
jgi:simple sugar transport system ATP-binding protein